MIWATKYIEFKMVIVKNKIRLPFLILITNLFILIQPSYTNAQQEISFGLKSGITFGKVGSIDELYESFQSEGYPKHSYIPGYYVSLFGKLVFNKEISLQSEIYILRYIAQITITTTIEPILEKQFKATYIHLPFLVRYQTNWFIKPYFILGIDAGYLVKAEHKEYDLFYDTFNGSFDITNQLPKMDLSFNIGLGIERELFEQKMIFQVNLILGITKYTSSESDYTAYEPEFLKSWRNNTLLLGIGTYF